MNQLEYFHLENKVLKPKIQKMYNSKLSLLKYFDDIYKEHFVQNYHALQFCKEIDYPNID